MRFKNRPVFRFNSRLDIVKPIIMVCQSKMPVEERAILGEQLVFNCGKTAKNRFMKAALSESQGTWNPENPKEHGHPTQQLINLYSKWGHGGYGLLLTGNVIIDMNHIETAGNVIVSKENDSPKLRQRLKEMATACNAEGTLSIAQIGHAGRQTKITFNKAPFSSSDVQLEGNPFGKFGKPVPLTVEQIQTEVIDRFVFAAKVLKEAGFHGIQLHGAHGYLLAQFMSLTTNKRTDQYGGSAENRFRIVKEVYQAIREEIPASTGFIVGLKMNSVEFQEQGLQTDDARIMCDLVEELGFDFVEMSGGTYEKLAFEHTKESTRKREAFFVEFTDYLRSSFKNTKMYLTGGFRSAEGMIHAIENNSCDGIGLGRPTTAEPDLPKKLLSGETPRALAPALPEEAQTFPMFLAISKTQMWQAGQSAFHNNNHYEGMSDLTNKEIVFAYLAGVTEFLKEAATTGKSDDVKYGIFKFTNDEQN